VAFKLPDGTTPAVGWTATYSDRLSPNRPCIDPASDCFVAITILSH
jgi:hypothetical protein